MDASNFFYRTNCFCSLHGVPTNVSRQLNIVYYCKLIVTVALIVINIVVFGQVSFRVSLGHYSLTDLLRVFLSFVAIKSFYDLEYFCPWLDRSVSFMLGNLSKKYIDKICHLDLMLFLFMITVSTSLISWIAYVYITDQFAGLRTFIAGPEDNSSDFGILILIIHLYFILGCILISSVFYIQIQVLSGLYCESLNDSLILCKSVMLDKLIKQCRYINRIRNLINRSIGFIPFALILSIWFFFVFGLSFANAYDNIKHNGLTLALIIILIINGLILLELLIRSTTYFERSARQLRQSCANLTSLPEMCDQDIQYRMANLLNNFLTTEKLPVMMAYDLMQIKPNLAISLLDSMITFTVMILTSFRVYLK